MGLWDRAREAFGGAKKEAASIRVEGDRVVFTTLEGARAIPREPAEGGLAVMGTCKGCGAPVRNVVFTTAGAGEQSAVWRAYPLAVDGWICASCGWSAVPRRVSPAEMDTLVNTGVAHGREGQIDDAEYWFLRAVSSWPSYPPALANLAQVYVQRSESSSGTARQEYRREALKYLRRASAIPELFPPARVIVLSRLESLEGNEEEALARLDAVIAMTDLEPALRDEATSLVKQIKAGNALFSRASELTQGRILLHGVRLPPLDAEARRALETAIGFLRASLERDPEAVASWFLLGKAQQRLGDLVASKAALARGLAANPDHAGMCRELVGACLELGDAEEALPIAKRACALEPGDAGLRANLAVVLLLAGRLDEASAAVDEALHADPQDGISASLARRIAEIREGRRPLPRTLAQLEGRARA